jgi:hypothetical protein
MSLGPQKRTFDCGAIAVAMGRKPPFALSFDVFVSTQQK